VPESPLVFANANTIDSFFLDLPKQNVSGKAIVVQLPVIMAAMQAHNVDSLRSVLAHAGRSIPLLSERRPLRVDRLRLYKRLSPANGYAGQSGLCLIDQTNEIGLSDVLEYGQ
jgi:hypothetical protein